jgi:cytochrome c5
MVDGVGGTTGPDLSRRLDRDYTPAGMASRMWNHAPAMWSAMGGAGITPPKLTEQQSADLFAFFLAKRFFEARGDAGRGKHVFQSLCAECHKEGGVGGGVSGWKTLSDSVELAERMWNHSLGMQKALAEKRKKWPLLRAQEMTDLLVYLQNLPETRGLELTFRLPDGGGGKQLLEAKGCTRCHAGSKTLEGKLGGRSMTELTAGLWNHAPGMRWMAEPLSGNELRQILAYVWQPAYYRPPGSADRGESLYGARCGSCHENGTTPNLKQRARNLNTVGMVSALWNHGPQMLERLRVEGKQWPELTEAEIGNLLAFLNAGYR